MNSNFASRFFSSSFPVRYVPKMANLSIPLKATGINSSFFSIPEMMGIGGSSTLFSSSFQQIRGLKVGVSITRRCENCYIVVRNGIRYVYCKVNRRHKRRQG